MHVRTWTIVAALLLGGTAFGLGGVREAPRTLDDGRPRAGAVQRGCGGKPTSALGSLDAWVTERPSEDRAWVEVRWTKAASAGYVELDLVLPLGTWCVEGPVHEALPAGEMQGTLRCLLGFETGSARDLVVRMSSGGRDAARSIETYVRLVSDEPSGI